MARTKRVGCANPASIPIFPCPVPIFPSPSSSTSAISSVEAAVRRVMETPQSEDALQNDFGSGLIEHLEEGQDGVKEGEDGDEDIEDADLVDEANGESGFWEPLIQIAGAQEVNHVEALFASLPNASDKQVAVDVMTP